MLIPHLDPAEPTSREIVELPVGTLLAGWLVAGGVLMLSAARAPFRIRLAARRLRRLRELEREVQQLRTLPLRQQEEDELLAAEARLDVRERRVMTQLDLSATDFGGEEGDLSQLSLASQPVERTDDGESETRGSTQ